MKNDLELMRKVLRHFKIKLSQINVSFELEEHSFTEVLNSLNGFDKQHYKQKIIVHISYRVSFRNTNKTWPRLLV